MVVVSVFELSLSEPIVKLGRFTRGRDGSLVHNTVGQTFAIQGTVLSLPAITCGRCGVGGRSQGLGVMGCYDGSHVAHTTVTALNVPAVEQFVVPVIPGKVLVH